MRSKRIDAVIIQPTLLNQRAVELALKYRLPLFSLARTVPGMGRTDVRGRPSGPAFFTFN
jgi:hypothetical protein